MLNFSKKKTILKNLKKWGQKCGLAPPFIHRTICVGCSFERQESSISSALQKIISEGRKPNKIWVDQGVEFYNNSFKRFL